MQVGFRIFRVDVDDMAAHFVAEAAAVVGVLDLEYVSMNSPGVLAQEPSGTTRASGPRGPARVQ